MQLVSPSIALSACLVLSTAALARAQDPKPDQRTPPTTQKPAEKPADKPAEKPGARPEAKTADAEPAFETMTRTLKDGIVMTGDLYRVGAVQAGAPEKDPAARKSAESKPILVCMHQTASSRGEYRKIAPMMVALGYNVLAVDLRCGGEGEVGNRKTGVRSGTMNETWKMAKEKLGHAPSYAEAYPDVGEAVAWAHELFPHSRLGLVGSSYSATLALVFGAEHGDQVDAVVAFSPGEYIQDWSIKDKIKKIDVPCYITCGNTAADLNQAQPLAQAIENKQRVIFFSPEDEKVVGDHGAKTLLIGGDSQKRQWEMFERGLAPLGKPLDAKDTKKRAAKPDEPPKK
jgi:dienelactone hydrolase